VHTTLRITHMSFYHGAHIVVITFARDLVPVTG
jgi:hypothetical protein